MYYWEDIAESVRKGETPSERALKLLRDQELQAILGVNDMILMRQWEEAARRRCALEHLLPYLSEENQEEIRYIDHWANRDIRRRGGRVIGRRPWYLI